MISRRLRGTTLASLLLGIFGAHCNGQVGQADGLGIPESLHHIDRLLQAQEREQREAMNGVLSEDGKQTPRWWQLSRRFDPVAVHGQLLVGYASDHAGTPEALSCLCFIIDRGEGEPGDVFRAACDGLIANYSNDPALSWICSRCTNAIMFEGMKSFLTRLRDASSNPTVQAAADYHLAELMDNAIEKKRMMPEIWEGLRASGAIAGLTDLDDLLQVVADLNSDGLRSERDKLLKQVKERFGDQKPWSAKRGSGSVNYEFTEDPEASPYGELSDGLVYEIRNLRPGCLAPDIDGSLTDGRGFRLRDRAGKPTLLMFSFKGCLACERTYPALRSVQQRFADSGFSVIGIMADEDLDTVAAAINAGEITWPCVWDGPLRPIAKKYRVRGYPTVVLLDRDGQIASTYPHEEGHLVRHIEELINDQKGEKAD